MRRISGRRRLAMREIRHLNKFAGLPDEMNISGRHPRAFVVADSHLSFRTDTHSVGGAQPGGKHLELLAVFRNLKDAAIVIAQRPPTAPARVDRSAFREIEVSLRISLQIERELVKTGRDLNIIVEALVPVRFG